MVAADSLGWRQLVAVALITGLVSSLGTGLFLQGSPPHLIQALDTGTEASLRQIREVLEEVRQLEPATIVVPADSQGRVYPERTVVTAAASDQEGGPDRLARLETAVQQIRDLLAQQGAAAAGPIPRHVPINHGEIAALHALEQSDRKKAEQSTVFLTPQQVVQRFGFPDEIGAANGADFYWSYEPPPGAEDGGMMLVFRSGYVAYHQLR